LKEKQNHNSYPIPVFVDEAQLYPPVIVEKIRLLADTRKYKFIFTVHKTERLSLKIFLMKSLSFI